MLPREHRLVRPADFSSTVRAGRRAGDGVLVVHWRPARASSEAGATGAGACARAGFVVSKAVGGAVVRNRVKRRLRHLVGERLADLAPGDRVVVRALPASAEASFGELSASLDRCLHRARAPRARSVEEAS